MCMRGAVSGSNGLPSLQFALSPVATRNGLTRSPSYGRAGDLCILLFLLGSCFLCLYSAHPTPRAVDCRDLVLLWLRLFLCFPDSQSFR